MVLTRNEQGLITYLWRNYTEQLSINELAKRTSITPKGAYIILKKNEKIGLVTKKTIANAVIYRLNYQDKKTKDVVEYALKSEQPPNSYVAVLEKDLQLLQKIADAAILFGSVLTKGLQANDLDVLVIINPKHLPVLKAKIKEFESISPKKVHLIIQTKADMQKNLRKKDSVIIEVLQKGHILWGYDLLYQLIENIKNQEGS
jgi:predicted nucleotidyltransferase